MFELQDIEKLSEELAHEFKLDKFGVFGSVARGEQTTNSDLDVYAEFADPTPETMFDRYFGLIAALKNSLKCEVQVVTPSMIRNPIFKRSLERDLIILHG